MRGFLIKSDKLHQATSNVRIKTCLLLFSLLNVLSLGVFGCRDNYFFTLIDPSRIDKDQRSVRVSLILMDMHKTYDLI